MLTMSVTLSPLRSQDPDPMATDASPMAINMTPTVEQGQGEGEESMKDIDATEQQYGKPPPLHTVADWKIVLHLPEIETWLRMTSERVRDLTYSVQQDADSKHVDVHLVQLKDICEDISDHVEQIHALLETEFSLKLLSYSVNVIVDIHAVQLLWHQLRVSVLVLRERILQGLQDANGNYTRQTDILQAFSEETTEGRLDSLTEVDDSGQLTIKCSQNYLSLDCGITAFELSDYSPSEDLLGGLGDMTTSQANAKPFDSWSYSEMEEDFPEIIRSVGLLTVATEPVPSSCGAANEDSSQVSLSEEHEGGHEEDSAPAAGEQQGSTPGTSSSGDKLTDAAPQHLAETTKQDPSSALPLGAKKAQPGPCEITTPKRSIRDCFNYNEDSPTQPSLPKRGLFLKESRKNERKGSEGKRQVVDLKPELSRSTPSLVDPPDRSKLCLILQSSYPSSPSAASQSYECLHKVGIGNLENLVRSHIKEISSSLGRLTDCHKEKLGLKKPHKTLVEAPLCRTPKSGTGSGKPAENTRSSTVPSTVPLGAPKATVRPETDSASTSSVELCHQKNRSGPLPERSEASSSPLCSHSGESSVGSDNTKSPVSLLSKSESQRESSPAPSHVTQNGQVVEAWYGSDEYLALPSHLRQTEVLALKLENLTKLLPPKPRGETIQDIDDWELSEMNSDSEIYPTYHIKKKHTRLGRMSPSSSSDIASSLGESIESGPLSDILSDEDLCMPLTGMKKFTDEKSERPSSSEKNESHSVTKSAFIQKLMQDIQTQDNYEAIWERIEAFVNKLDQFIQWLNEATETTENWTPPKAETDSLRLYLETHLSFKLNVDSHCALKEAVEEEGHQLLELIASHKAGLKDMLKMIASQWKELQRQIKRQHSWILRALDTIKAEILATDVSVEDEEGTGSPKAEVQLCYLEAQRDAVEQMSLKLYSEQYTSGSKRKEEFADMSKAHSVGSDGLLDFDSEYQELWDWLIDMESLVMDSHDLMMSEEQQQHLYKRYSVEMSIRHLKKTELLSKVEALKKGGVSLPNDLLEKVDSINEKWELLGKTLREKIQDTMAGHSGSGPRDLLSPESGSLVRQLEVRIKELKRWLRDTELFIFNSCLRQEKEGTSPEKQLQYFKSLCHEIKQRRRGVASVLRLCQHLLDDRDTCNLNADHQPMQLIIVNLERRWEAIVMQAVQWRTRLQKKMGNESETLNVIDPGLMDLNGMSEDALEWDETDISNKLISLHEESNDLDQDAEAAIPSAKLKDAHHKVSGYEEEAGGCGGSQYTSNITAPSSPQIYQVYSLHNIELHEDSHTPFLKSSPKFTGPAQPTVLTKSLSKDSSFSSTKSLPDLLGGSSLVRPCPCHSGDVSQNSGSESGIVSEGDSEMPASSEMCLFSMVDGSPSNPETEHLGSHMGDAGNVLEQKCEEEKESIKLPSISQASISPVGWVNGKAGDLNSVTRHTADCFGEELQGKHDVFTFYDYSYLQGSKLKLPTVRKQSQSEKAHVEDPLLCGFYFDKKSCKSKHQASELQADAPPHERILASAPHELGRSSYKGSDIEKALVGIQNARQLSLLSRSSSVESLSPGGDLSGLGIFKNGSDSLQRSTSLESWLTSYKSNEDLFSCHSSGDISVSSGSVGELSKRTLDLLNRLENIQSPSEQKIKRSVSDITLQSSSQRMSFTGQMSLDVASSINEDSAASLTELSSSDELSLCSEDIVLHKNKIPESNASFRKRLNRSVADESDVNVSMIVNVSCTSACTDDEDDSDLLSSSTLTLTEEELCLKDEDDDSSIATDDEIYEESNLMSGLDYIKNELQTWIRPKFSLTRDKKRCGVTDGIKGSQDRASNEKLSSSDTLNIEALLNGSIKCLSENNGNGKNPPRTHDLGTRGENKRSNYEVSKDPHMADVENGNIENAPEKQKEKPSTLPEVLENLDSNVRKMPEPKPSESKALTEGSDDSSVSGKEFAPPNDRHLPQIGLTIQPSENQSADCTPVENSGPETLLETRVGSRQDSDGLKSLSNDAPSGASKSAGCCLLGQNETEESAPISNSTSCCSCGPDVFHQKDDEDCSVHDFVKEIIDMASTALKSKSQPESEVAAPTSLTQIKEKVLEHSHRPIHLRKGDFYSYLSLSSHDSDCGEVTSYIDEKSSTPLPPDTVDPGLDDKEDIECFFEACVEDDDPADEKAHFPSALPNEPEVPDEAAKPVQMTASSPVFSGETDMVVALPGPSAQKRADDVKERDEVPRTSQDCAESSELTISSGRASKEGSSRNQGESGMPEENAASAKSKIQALPLNAKQPKGKAVLYPSPQTLTCKEKLVSFHEDRHRNMHR
ncbi:LOW QUALITY PROTEIN: A-kinase anchor protein 6 [Acomys russatus]|uniref:LOW QUALITY PROTEIN: A-kinase anchor protein 6 n=1 Tax=Acomys russatus TaxID=60746 RepID=UPI0021E30F92|nr:LOW QUALITY PROTEIN: A-kinase anchor protein 6 [Acomys russatus]